MKDFVDKRSPACAFKLAATPASCARSTLSGLTVSQSRAMAAIIMPSWACAWLCCALKGLHVPKHCHCCLPVVGAKELVSLASRKVLRPHLAANPVACLTCPEGIGSYPSMYSS